MYTIHMYFVYKRYNTSLDTYFTTDYTFTPCGGAFTSPGIDTRYKGSTIDV